MSQFPIYNYTIFSGINNDLQPKKDTPILPQTLEKRLICDILRIAREP
jgi:hypothetical protein